MEDDVNIQKNQIFTVKITDMGTDGEGIGHLEDSDALSGNGYTLFVKDAVLGDTVRAKVVKPKKDMPLRVWKKCWNRLPTAWSRSARMPDSAEAVSRRRFLRKQLAFKDRKVKNNLIRIGGFAPDFVEEIMEAPVGMEHPFHYRNKAQFPVGMDKNGRLIAGFYAGRTHTIIENRDCALGVAENKIVLDIVLDFVRKRKFQHTMKRQESGLLRHVLIRKGFSTGQIMVCLILNGSSFAAEQELQDRLFEKVPGMTSFSVNSNTERTNVIMGSKTRTIRGKDRIEDTIGGLVFTISPQSFIRSIRFRRKIFTVRRFLMQD